MDLDNTLIDRAAGFDRWAADFVSERALPSQSLPVLHGLDDDGRTGRSVFFERLVEALDLPDAPDELVRRYHDEFPRYIPPPEEGLIRALAAVRESGWAICIVTNGGPWQARKIEATGLHDVVDASCISGVIGHSKPNPLILSAAAALVRRQVSPDDWMVGDRADADMLCAHRAGVHGAWIHRGRTWEDPAFAPDLQVDSAGEAVAAIVSP